MKLLRLLPILALGACVLGAEQYPSASELEDSWSAARLRVLAIAAEPPEVAPGETTALSMLLADPQDEMGTEGVVLWAACLEEEVLPIGCFPDFETFDNVIGITPGLEPTWTAPDDLLDALEEDEALEGVYAYVSAVVIPEELAAGLLSGEDVDTGEVDFSQVKIATKIVVVSKAPTPNANPRLTAFTADGLDVPPDSTLLLDGSEPYELGVVIPDEDVEDYEYVNRDGEVEQRTEEPYVVWYADLGELEESTTLHPYTQADWIAPEADVDGTVYAVLRDRRGGIAWWRQDISTR